MAALGLVFVMATALVTGLVVANWSGSSQEPELRRQAPAASRSWQSTRTVSVKPSATPIVRGLAGAGPIPTPEAVRACNQRAADEVAEPERAEDAVKMGGLVKSVASGGEAGAGNGTLYGLNESRRNDEKYRAAYTSCMRARGYVAG
jgi:hypothetical protein